MSKRRFQLWLLLSIMGMVTGPSLAGTPRGERDLPSFAAGGPPVVFRSDSLLLAAGDRMLRVGFVGARQCSPVGSAAAGRVVYEG
ncbi:MAG TPA: hypothetical protein PKK12_07980, partial [Candidatus Aminicenantes bacterium]|nr:hypothetical protein [Candidatus Aminicenantes bacterium]